jgi:hypothetical protein
MEAQCATCDREGPTLMSVTFSDKATVEARRIVQLLQKHRACR